jgi:hypothetical protein
MRPLYGISLRKYKAYLYELYSYRCKITTIKKGFWSVPMKVEERFKFRVQIYSN